MPLALYNTINSVDPDVIKATTPKITKVVAFPHIDSTEFAQADALYKAVGQTVRIEGTFNIAKLNATSGDVHTLKLIVLDANGVEMTTVGLEGTVYSANSKELWLRCGETVIDVAAHSAYFEIQSAGRPITTYPVALVGLG